MAIRSFNNRTDERYDTVTIDVNGRFLKAYKSGSPMRPTDQLSAGEAQVRLQLARKAYTAISKQQERVQEQIDAASDRDDTEQVMRILENHGEGMLRSAAAARNMLEASAAFLQAQIPGLERDEALDMASDGDYMGELMTELGFTTEEVDTGDSGEGDGTPNLQLVPKQETPDQSPTNQTLTPDSDPVTEAQAPLSTVASDSPVTTMEAETVVVPNELETGPAPTTTDATT